MAKDNDTSKTNPYPGPRPFKLSERELFFGREAEEPDLLSLTVANRAILIYSASGAGKTSLLSAGLVPLLVDEGFDVLPVARVGARVPESVPRGEIANIFTFSALTCWLPREADATRYAGMTLKKYLESTEKPLAEDEERHPRLIVFDQFEEIFTSHEQRWQDREPFFRQVQEALEDDLLRAIFAMREEYLGHLAPYVKLLPDHLSTRYRLECLREKAAMRAVETPASRHNRPFADDAARRLVRDLMTLNIETPEGELRKVPGEFVEPVYLQVVCRTLWDRLPESRTEITVGDLEQCANVNEALGAFYEQTLLEAMKQSDVSEATLRNWFATKLVTPAGTRGTVYRGGTRTDGIPNATVDHLARKHLLKPEHRSGATWYELPHDRFIEPIRIANEHWLEKRLAGEQREMLEELKTQARAWQRKDQDRHLLLPSKGLHEAQQLMADPVAVSHGFDDAMAAYVQASQAERERKWVRRLSIVSSILLVAVVGLALAVFWAVKAKNQAAIKEQLARAQHAQLQLKLFEMQASQIWATRTNHLELAGIMDSWYEDTRTAESLKVTAEEARQEATAIRNCALNTKPEVEHDLEQVVRNSPDWGYELHECAQKITGSAKENPTWAVRTALASATQEGTSAKATERLREAMVRSRMDALLRGHLDKVWGVAFDPEGRYVATASADSTAIVWNAGTGSMERMLEGHEDEVFAVAFRPGHPSTLVTAGADGKVIFWDVLSGEQTHHLPHEGFSIHTIAFAPDGSRLVVGMFPKGPSEAGPALVYDVERLSSEPVVLRSGSNTSQTFTVAFHPAGNEIATGGLGPHIRLFDGTGRQLQSVDTRSNAVYSLDFSEDGHWIGLSALGLGSNVCPFDLEVAEGEKHLRMDDCVPIDDERMPGQIRFVPGKGPLRLATTGIDGTAKLWTLGAAGPTLSAVFAGHQDGVYGVDFSPDGSRLVTGSQDHTARIWYVDTDPIEKLTVSELKQKAIRLAVF